jgi:hypothetical protein
VIAIEGLTPVPYTLRVSLALIVIGFIGIKYLF